MAMEDFGPRLDLFGRTFVDDMAVVDDVDALRERKRCRQVLLDENDRLASVGEVAARFHEIADNDRREALELIEDQIRARIAQATLEHKPIPEDRTSTKFIWMDVEEFLV